MKKLAGLVLGIVLMGGCGGILIGRGRLRYDANNLMESYEKVGWKMTHYIEDDKNEFTITCYFNAITGILSEECLEAVITKNETRVSKIDCAVPQLKPQYYRVVD